MESITKSVVVPFSAEQMYELVNDVSAYPDFLPWCSAAQIHEQSEHYMKASVSLASGAVRQTFTTANTLTPGQRIEVALVSGPFKQLNGFWSFENAGEGMSKIDFRMSFEYRNKIVKLALNKIFTRIGDTLVSSFVERAHSLYGSR